MLQQVRGLSIRLRQELLENGSVDRVHFWLVHLQLLESCDIRRSLDQFVREKSEFTRLRHFVVATAGVAFEHLSAAIQVLKLWLRCVPDIDEARLQVLVEGAASLRHIAMVLNSVDELVRCFKELVVVADLIGRVNLVKFTHRS